MIDKKMLVIVGLVAICIILIWSSISNWSAKNSLQKDNKKLVDQQMQANYDLGKAQTQFGDAQKQLKAVNEEIQLWIKENNAKATDVGILQGRLRAIMSGSGGQIEIVRVPGETVIREVNGATGTCEITPITEADHVDSLGKYVWLDTDNDGKPDTKTSKIALNYKDYRIDISVDAIGNVFNYSLHQNFKGQFVKAITKEGGVVHFIKLDEVDDKGNKVGEIEITDFKVTTEDQSGGKKHMFWWDPQIDIGVNVNMSNKLSASTGPEIGISTSGYGKTADDNDLRLFRFSIGKNGDEMMYNFSPACWNAGKSIPLVKDLLLCPTVGYSDLDTIYGISLGNTF